MSINNNRCYLLTPIDRILTIEIGIDDCTLTTSIR